MPIPNSSAKVVIDLSRAEQWVVHHVMLDSVGLANGSPPGAVDLSNESTSPIRVLEKLEAGTFKFTRSELRLIHIATKSHARTTEQAADRNLASAVADRVEPVIGDRTPATTARQSEARSG